MRTNEYEIVLVEDDDEQRAFIKLRLKEAFPRAAIQQIVSEEQFLRLARVGTFDRSNAVVMDLMLRWTTQENYVEMPEEIEREKYYKAGIRCVRALRQRGGYVPCILYTLVEHQDVASDLSKLWGVDYVNKSEPQKLISMLEGYLSVPRASRAGN